MQKLVVIEAQILFAFDRADLLFVGFHARRWSIVAKQAEKEVGIVFVCGIRRGQNCGLAHTAPQ